MILANSTGATSSTWKATAVSGGGLTWGRAGGGANAQASGNGFVDIWTAIDAAGAGFTLAVTSNGDQPGRVAVVATTGGSGVGSVGGATGAGDATTFTSSPIVNIAATSLVFGAAYNWATTTPPTPSTNTSYLTGAAGTSAFATADGGSLTFFAYSPPGGTSVMGRVTGVCHTIAGVEIKA